MMPTLWAMAGGIIAVALEYHYRLNPDSFLGSSLIVIPANIVIAYCVFRLVTTPGTSLIAAFVVWSFATIVLRVGVSVFLLGDKVAAGTWAALCLIVAAKVVQAAWK